MSEESTPGTTPRAPKDTRLLIRVSSADLRFWRYIVEDIEFRSLSAMIRAVVNDYVANPAPGFDVWELPYETLAEAFGDKVDSSELSKMTHYDKTIFLRVSAAEQQRWTRAAEAGGRSLSGMIRRAVKRHAWHHMDILRYAQKGGG